jgi:hypothetical protein
VTFKVLWLPGALAIFMLHNVAFAELEPKCAENSPERHGDFGCSYVADQALPGPLKEPLFWHIEPGRPLGFITGAHRIPKGGSLAVPAGITMRLVATGSKPRRGFAIVVYDASQPPTTRTEELESQLVLCR